MGKSGGKIESVVGGRLRIDHASNRLIVTDADNVDKLIAGLDNAGGIVVKIAQDGVDVKTASDDQLVFSSENNLFKIIDTGTTQMTLNGTTGTLQSVSVTHDLGYSPMVIAWTTHTGEPTQTNPLPFLIHNSSTGILRGKMYIESHTDRFTFIWQDISMASTQTYTFRYYVIVETSAI